MQVSDEQHLDAVIAFSESWRANMALPEDERMGVAVGAALAVLPEPASAADALPVPGAAVRALVARWESATFFPAQSLAELKLALEQDGLASQALPSRDEIAASLRAAKFGGEEVPAPYSEIDQRVRDNWLRAADKAIELLARRPAADEAEALWKRLEIEQTCESQDEELAQLRDQLAALRAACTITPAERAAMSFWPNQHSKECAQLETLQSYACRVERALLKPAPAEADPVIVRFRANPPLMEPVQPPSPESKRPASLREVWAAIDGLRESLETAWEVNELHEALLRALRNAVVMTPIEQRDLDPVLHAMDAIDARWRERGRK